MKNKNEVYKNNNNFTEFYLNIKFIFNFIFKKLYLSMIGDGIGRPGQ